MKKLLFICLFLSSSVTGIELAINPVTQDSSNWCWAACCEMIHDAYKVEEYGSYGSGDQYDVAVWAVSGQNIMNSLCGTEKTVDRVLWHYGEIGTNPNSIPLLEEDLTREIYDGKPIIARITLDNNVGHAVLIKGYTGSGGFDVGNVIFNDPRPNRGHQVMPYDTFVGGNGTSWEWNATLRLTSLPRVPIPLGTGPGNRVRLDDDNCTTEITQSPQSLSYRAEKRGDSPVSWEWKLIFPHSNGEAIVASWNTNTSQEDLTWNIPGFTLPSNYNWSYSFDGKIVGRIKVVCMDPDYHYDAINVIYVPSNLYPGCVLYEDHTVSGTQPQVKAHQVIVTQNDQFLSGSSITFKSGERIDIKDGITIRNGSTTNFTIDPSIR